MIFGMLERKGEREGERGRTQERERGERRGRMRGRKRGRERDNHTVPRYLVRKITAGLVTMVTFLLRL